MSTSKLSQELKRIPHPHLHPNYHLNVMHDFQLTCKRSMVEEKVAEEIREAMFKQWNQDLSKKVGFGEPSPKKPFHAELLGTDRFANDDGVMMLRAHINVSEEPGEDEERGNDYKRIEVEFKKA